MNYWQQWIQIKKKYNLDLLTRTKDSRKKWYSLMARNMKPDDLKEEIEHMLDDPPKDAIKAWSRQREFYEYLQKTMVDFERAFRLSKRVRDPNNKKSNTSKREETNWTKNKRKRRPRRDCLKCGSSDHLLKNCGKTTKDGKGGFVEEIL